MRRLSRLARLLNRCGVVEDPQAATMGGDDHVVVARVNLDFVDRPVDHSLRGGGHDLAGVAPGRLPLRAGGGLPAGRARHLPDAALVVEPQQVVLGQAESADGSFSTDAGMWSVPVVSVQPVRQLSGSLP